LGPGVEREKERERQRRGWKAIYIYIYREREGRGGAGGGGALRPGVFREKGRERKSESERCETWSLLRGVKSGSYTLSCRGVLHVASRILVLLIK
jgi:hypothetical protein